MVKKNNDKEELSREEYIKKYHKGRGSEGISFDVINADTIDKLQREGRIETPKYVPKKKKVKIPKDKRWNEKQIASKILRGIQNGDSVYDISKSLVRVVGNNEASAMRRARTMTTSAECGGRLDSYRTLEAKGVIQKKVWMSTPDDRTRPTHVDIDGQERDIEERFSNGCMYPGDGSGPAEEVWMCRCTMTDHIVGFRMSDGSISKVKY